MNAVFSPSAADISSDEAPAARAQRQKRSENAVFRVVREWNRACTYLTARRDRIALLLMLFSLADTRRLEINDPGRCARLATCESEAQLNLCTSLGSRSSPVRRWVSALSCSSSFFAQDTPPTNASFWVERNAPPLSHIKHLSQVTHLWHFKQMDVHLSIKAKLVLAANAGQELKSTMEEFNRACNTLSELAFQLDLHRKYDIHHQGYLLIREETSLPSQHVINAIAKVSAVYTRDSNKWHQFKPHSSVRYDAKSMTLRPDSQTVSLAVCPKGRVTGRLQMSARMRNQLQQGELGSAELVCRKGNFYLHISITVPEPEVKQPQGSLGVDLGFSRVAVTSDNKFHTAKNIRHKKACYRRTRRSLQANGSKSAKRTLKRVSGRERR